ECNGNFVDSRTNELYYLKDQNSANNSSSELTMNCGINMI
ncbi:14099_t:CDS:1, partial [Funneliformis mosseae]